MKSLLLMLLMLLAAGASARFYDRCQWAKTLRSYGMDGYRGYSLANWVCLTQWESHYDTSAINHNTDGSTDYGIFQINSRWWCNDGKTQTANGCNIACSALLTDNVAVAINCAKRVVQDPRGMAAWVGWRRNCMNRDLSSYLAGCQL